MWVVVIKFFLSSNKISEIQYYFENVENVTLFNKEITIIIEQTL